MYLCPPGEESGPAITGTAVIHTGEYLGQRVEFDRSVCWAYTFSLAKSDLGYFMKKGDKAIFYTSNLFNFCSFKCNIKRGCINRKTIPFTRRLLLFENKHTLP